MAHVCKGIIVGKYRGNALFYKLKYNLSFEDIIKVMASRETHTQIKANLSGETHWLADWEGHSENFFKELVDGDEVEVEFEMRSTAHKKHMWHGNSDIGPCRNLNINSVRRI